MELTLSLKSYQRLSPEQESEKTFNSNGGTIGRSSDCDWCLPDPEKIISGKHIIIRYENNEYRAIDNSTNGLFIERSVEPLGRNNSVVLKEGLHLALGDYELEVSAIGDSANLKTESQQKVSQKKTSLDSIKNASQLRNSSLNIESNHVGQNKIQQQFVGSKFNSQKSNREENDSAALIGVRARPLQPVSQQSSQLLGDSKSLDVSPMYGESARFQGDEHFQPPAFIPGNWDEDFLDNDPVIQIGGNSNNSFGNHKDFDSKITKNNAEESQSDDDKLSNLANEMPLSHQAVSSSDTSSSEQLKKSSSSFANEINRKEFFNENPVDSFQRQQLENYRVDNGQALDAFLRGLNVNLNNLNIQSEIAFFEDLGRVLSALFQGMLDTLASRSSLKNEFRVLQTTIKANENNPLKFSASVEDAIRNVFGHLGGNFLGPKEAVEQAFQDINQHQLALLSGTQGALFELLGYIDPRQIESRVETGKSVVESILPAAIKAKYWDFYREIYDDLMKDADGNSPKFFTSEFAKAYEKQLRQFE